MIFTLLYIHIEYSAVALMYINIVLPYAKKTLLMFLAD